MKSANSKVIYQQIKSQLLLDEPGEIQTTARLIVEKYYGLTWADVLSEKEVSFIDLTSVIDRVSKQEPLQYVLGEADFYGKKYIVNPSTLIPRPETELLIQEVLNTKLSAPRILDVGTGSGCIAVTLSLEMPSAKVSAIDVSQDALEIARANAQKHKARVDFTQADFLSGNLELGAFDIIVSNPPYVLNSEKQWMKSNVLDYEPHLALFVPNDDPLIFYKAIASKSKSLLHPDGKIFVEINAKFGNEVVDLFRSTGFKSVKIIKDFDGKDRIVSAE